MSGDPLQFRIYVLSVEGHIRKGEWIEASDRETAIKLAEAWLGDTTVEVWEGAVRIACLKPKKKPP